MPNSSRDFLCCLAPMFNPSMKLSSAKSPFTNSYKFTYMHVSLVTFFAAVMDTWGGGEGGMTVPKYF